MSATGMWLKSLLDSSAHVQWDSELLAQQPVIATQGTIHGKPVAVYAQNPNVNQGYMDAESADKICRLLDDAEAQNIPVIALLASPGISFDDQLSSGVGYTKVIRRTIELGRVIPQIALIMGPVLGAPAYSAVLMDMILFSQHRSFLMITGPGVVQKAIGQKTTLAELGSADMHSQKTGLADFVLAKPEDQIQFARLILNYIHGRFPSESPKVDMPQLPQEMNTVFDMTRLIEAIVDASEYHTYKTYYGPSIICAFARLDGRSIGIVANQSMYFAGAITCEAALKAAQFIRLCDQYHIPLIMLIDVPGFMPGTHEEQNGLLRYGADFCRAMQTQVMRMSVVVRRCYGAAAFLLMQTKALKGQVSLALRTAHLGVMGRQSIDTFRAESSQKATTLEYAQELNLFDEIIRPEEIRSKLIHYLKKNLEPACDFAIKE